MMEHLWHAEVVRFGEASVAALALDVSVIVALREAAGLPALADATVGFLTGALFHYGF